MSPHRSRHRSAGRASGTPAAGQCDAAGNMTSLQTGGDTGTTYTEKWDAWGRLVEVNSASGTPVESYSYNGTGRRIELTSYNANGDVTGVTHYYLSGQQVIQTSVTAGQTNPGPDDIQYQYVWSPRYIDAPILRDTYSGGTEVPATSGGRLYYLDNANYNVTAVVQYNAGAWGVAERYQYDPDGNVTYWTTGWQPETTRATNNTILFAGCELDGVTGLYYMRARYYNPALNRFISRDPLGYAGSPINLYKYCDDDPLDATDPSGLNTIHWPWGEPTPTPPQPLPVTPTPGLPEPNWGLLAPGFGPGVATFSINAPLNSELFTTFGLLPKPPHLIIIQPSPLPGSPGSDTDPFGNPLHPPSQYERNPFWDYPPWIK